MQGTDEAPADHFPQLQVMIKAIEEERTEHLFDFFAELDQVFGSIYGTYLEELQYLAADDPQNDTSEKIGTCFAEIKPLISALRDDLNLEDLTRALETLESLEEASQDLPGLFQEFQDLSQSGPQFSEVPYTHELLRVCDHYLNGRLSVDAVQGRLESFCQYHESLETQISLLVPSQPEQEAFEERAEDLEEALNLQLQGIEDLDYALEQNDKEVLKESLPLLKESAEILVEIYRHLQDADLQPRTVVCVRCGAGNSLDAKICGECGAVLLQSAGSATFTNTLNLEEDGSMVGTQDPEEVGRLQVAVDNLLSTGEAQDLLSQIEHYNKRLQRSVRQFESLSAPPPEAPPEHAKILASARNHFGQALEELKLGLQQLSEGATEVDPLILESGMAAMRVASEYFAQFQSDFQRAQETQDQSN